LSAQSGQEDEAMAIAMIFDAPGLTQAQYERVHRLVSPGNTPPPGLLYHVAGPMEAGWRLVEVWESAEAAERFFRETLGPVLQAEGLPELRPQVFAAHTIMQP